MAREKNLDHVFPDVKAMKPNNGEVFLSKYHVQQVERNKSEQTEDGLCTCLFCVGCSEEEFVLPPEEHPEIAQTEDLAPTVAEVGVESVN